jgi:hypothetical protein
LSGTRATGREGNVAKRPDRPSGRSPDWIKVKEYQAALAAKRLIEL